MINHKVGAAVVAAGLAFASQAGAQELRISHIFPESHFLWQQGGKVFVDTLTEESAGTVSFQQYHAGQLGKDQLALLGSGLADIVITATGYSPDKLPLSGVAELPGLYATSCEGAARFWTIAQPGGALDQAEYLGQGFRALFVIAPPPFKVMTSRTEVSRFEDLAGLKLRAVGGAQTDTVRAVGASAVQIQAPEIYDSVSRGTADGAIYAYVGMPAFDLGKVLHYQVEGVTAGSSPVIAAISTRAWDALSPETQQAVIEASAVAQQNICEFQDSEEAAIRERYVQDGGLKITQFGVDDVAKWNAAMQGVVTDWAVKMDANNRPGSDIVKAWQAASE